MAEKQVPYSWAGQRVEASIVGPGSYSDLGTAFPMMASTHIGTLEMVTDLGIFAALSDLDEYEEEEPAVTTFYPWSSVLWLRPLERA